MSLDVIESRLKEYRTKTQQEELCALKEICQEIALCGLARGEFFKKAVFQGGTCLRIIHGLKRFSEDLDFILQLPNVAFNWEPYLKSIKLEFESFGLNLEVADRSLARGPIKRAFLKENSFGKILELKHEFLPSDKQSIKIKLEIDINPPGGSCYKTQYLGYPYPFSVLCQDLPSLFASKCHAILCRGYVKGRDWFDFLWYISKQVSINFELLSKALFQSGPFQGKEIEINLEWLVKNLQLKIEQLNWTNVRMDVENLLNLEDRKYVEHWNKDLFLSLLKPYAIHEELRIFDEEEKNRKGTLTLEELAQRQDRRKELEEEIIKLFKTS